MDVGKGSESLGMKIGAGGFGSTVGAVGLQGILLSNSTVPGATPGAVCAHWEQKGLNSREVKTLPNPV